jgi:hypothetical protein
LQVLCAEPEYHFPEGYVDRAKALQQRFESDNWGAPHPVIEEESEAQDDSDVSDEAPRKRKKAIGAGAGDDGDRATADDERPRKRRKGAPVSDDKSFTVLQPPIDHRIWGRDGIMHGIALRYYPGTGRYTKALNPKYKNDQRVCKVYGHNGLEVGQWFPSRLSTVFAGGHGHSQAGISGAAAGAYSVVVSGLYEHLDKDLGTTIYYSGSGSHANTDASQPAQSTTGTKTLHGSIKTRNPVRVFRTSDGRGEWAPVEGLRYDGLYWVEGRDLPRNDKGGLYERFKLVRLPNQPSLQECQKRPSQQQLRDFNKINDGYSGHAMPNR